MGNLCCAREHSVQFFVRFSIHSETAQFNLECMGLLIVRQDSAVSAVTELRAR